MLPDRRRTGLWATAEMPRLMVGSETRGLVTGIFFRSNAFSTSTYAWKRRLRESTPQCQHPNVNKFKSVSSSKFTSLATSIKTSGKNSKTAKSTQMARDQPIAVSNPSPEVTIPNFAFAFDIDGVLMHSSTPLPGSSQCLRSLSSQKIPFILLTNGGGKSEAERAAELDAKLFPARHQQQDLINSSSIPGPLITSSNLILSHTPFRALDQLKGKTVLVTGGDPPRCRRIAHGYGFKSVLIPGDLHLHYREFWPFNQKIDGLYTPGSGDYLLDLPGQPAEAAAEGTGGGGGVEEKELSTTNGTSDGGAPPPLEISAILIFNDPRDWSLDIQLITDLLLTRGGRLGTWSPLNGNPALPNHGYQQDSQPQIFFSHNDLLWSTGYHLPRLGLGGFRGALEGVWSLVTGGNGKEGGTKLMDTTTMGKPATVTYQYAEGVLRRMMMHHRQERQRPRGQAEQVVDEKENGRGRLKTVYMIGDNPASDIKGANDFTSSGLANLQWKSMLVKTGVWSRERNGDPDPYPSEGIFEDVATAVSFALRQESKKAGGIGGCGDEARRWEI